MDKTPRQRLQDLHEEWLAENPEVVSLLDEIGQSFPECGWSIGKGWFPIVADCLRKMTAEPVSWKLTQVKSKFCTLRVYYDVTSQPLGEREELRDLLERHVKLAEARCALSCEECGKPHGLTVPRSGVALCDGCSRRPPR